MISHSDPERIALLADRARRFDDLFYRGLIGESTYLRSLMIDGLLPDEARTRLSLLKMESRK